MKRTLIALATLLAVSVAAPAFARQAAPPPAKPEAAAAAATDPKLASSYVGKWAVALQGPEGPMQLVLDVKIDKANVVTGMLTGGPSGDSAIKGEFKDRKLGFGINFDAGGQMIEVWFESVLKDGKLAGNATVGDQMTLPWTAERPKGL